MKVLIVDDHPLVRKGIASVLCGENDIDAISEAATVDEALSSLIKNKPDITVLDLYLGKEDGLEIVRQARSKQMNSKFIVLTSSSKKEDFDRAKKENVDGYILKDAFADEFMYAVKVISRGKKFYDSTILDYHLRADKSNVDELTERELEILRELGFGHSNGQIAKNLFISENTVKKHVSTILSKLGMSHRTEAALYANKELGKSL